MKTIFFFFAMAATIITTATQPEPLVYYTGNDQPAANSVSRKNAADSLQLALTPHTPLVEAGGECPLYLTGQDEPVASSGVVKVEN
jgi:hypothetical protein